MPLNPLDNVFRDGTTPRPAPSGDLLGGGFAPRPAGGNSLAYINSYVTPALYGVQPPSGGYNPNLSPEQNRINMGLDADGNIPGQGPIMLDPLENSGGGYFDSLFSFTNAMGQPGAMTSGGNIPGGPLQGFGGMSPAPVNAAPMNLAPPMAQQSMSSFQNPSPFSYSGAVSNLTNQFQQSLQPGASPFQPQSPFGAMGSSMGGSSEIGAWRNLPPSGPVDFNAMASGLSGGVYQPPVRDVRFAGPHPAAAPVEPGGQGLTDGTGGVVGGTVAPVGNPINAADNYTGGLGGAITPPAGDVLVADPLPGGMTIGGVDSQPISQMPLGPIGGGPSGIGSIDYGPGSSIVVGGGGDYLPVDAYTPPVGAPAFDTGNSGMAPIEMPGFVTGPTLAPPPVVAPEPSYLEQLISGIGSAADFVATNAGNPYQPTTGNMNDPNYNWDWTTTGDRGGVGNQLAGLLNMNVIGGGGGIGNNTDTQNLGGQAFAPDYLGGGGIGDGTEVTDLEFLLSRLGAR